MRRERIPKNRRIPGGIRCGGDWEPLYVRQQQNQAGEPYQHYMYGPNGEGLCAGVTQHPRMNRATANQIRRVWERWRREYIAQRPGDYPTAQKVSIPVARVVVFPLDQPKRVQAFWFGPESQRPPLDTVEEP